MASLRCSLQGRHFAALLNGLKKGIFEGDEACSMDALAESLYAESGLPNDVIMAEIQSFEQVLRHFHPPPFCEFAHSFKLDVFFGLVIVTAATNRCST